MHGQTLASSIDLKLFTKKASILPCREYAFTAKMFGDCMSIKKQITYGTGSTSLEQETEEQHSCHY